MKNNNSPNLVTDGVSTFVWFLCRQQWLCECLFMCLVIDWGPIQSVVGHTLMTAGIVRKPVAGGPKCWKDRVKEMLRWWDGYLQREGRVWGELWTVGVRLRWQSKSSVWIDKERKHVGTLRTRSKKLAIKSYLTRNDDQNPWAKNVASAWMWQFSGLVVPKVCQSWPVDGETDAKWLQRTTPEKT